MKRSRIHSVLSWCSRHRFPLILGLYVAIYACYMSYFTIQRMHVLSAHYFDLGIMHQTVFNTFRAITGLDPSLILQSTNPHASDQIIRPAIHNDIILAFLAPFYLLYSGPETLLVIQSVVLAIGAVGLYMIAIHAWQDKPYARLFGLTVATAYLLSPAMNLTNIFEFHGVALGTTFLIFLYYFWCRKWYRWGIVMLVLALFTKEQVGLTTAMFALYAAWTEIRGRKKEESIWYRRMSWFTLTTFALSIVWFLFSMKVMIPYFREGHEHFALHYYDHLGDTPFEVIAGVFLRPQEVFRYIFTESTYEYLYKLFMPTGFLAILAPLNLAVALPEFAVVLLSGSDAMRLIIYHYTALLTPFLFIATIYGARRAAQRIPVVLVIGYLAAASIWSAYTYGPLPFARNANLYPFEHTPGNIEDVYYWKEQLADESLKVASTGKLAPFFTSRQYYYVMSEAYHKADYVVVNPDEVYNAYGKERAIPGYEALLEDQRYELIYDQNGIEVYQRIQSVQN